MLSFHIGKFIIGQQMGNRKVSEEKYGDVIREERAPIHQQQPIPR